MEGWSVSMTEIVFVIQRPGLLRELVLLHTGLVIFYNA